ncbi:MAG: tetratricopeptide repeat protein, partial [Alphaproteobacteria bacterium]
APAQTAMGEMYQTGKGVPKDPAIALVWYRNAAEQNWAMSQLRIGLMYLLGTGVESDPVMAADWVHKGARQDYAEAQTLLGVMYRDCYGVSKNYVKAEYWFRRAVKQGDAEAKTHLAKLLEHDSDNRNSVGDDAVTELRNTAAKGDAAAQYRLGLKYRFGLGVPKDRAKAIKWQELAARQNHADAQFLIGGLYFRGQGVPRDDIGAFIFLDMAAASNPPLSSSRRAEAIKKRDLVAARMTPAQFTEAMRRMRAWKSN